MNETQKATSTAGKRKAEILATWPTLADYEHDSYCCDACGYQDVFEDLGEAAADAWVELADCLFLLGELTYGWELMGYIDNPVFDEGEL